MRSFFIVVLSVVGVLCFLVAAFMALFTAYQLITGDGSRAVVNLLLTALYFAVSQALISTARAL